MPRLRVIILNQDAINPNSYTCLFWADVPTARQTWYANVNAKSAWTGAQAADETALQNGSMVETSTTHIFSSATAWPQVETYLQAQWQTFQTNITNANPWIRYGSTWDGTTWTLVTNG